MILNAIQNPNTLVQQKTESGFLLEVHTASSKYISANTIGLSENGFIFYAISENELRNYTNNFIQDNNYITEISNNEASIYLYDILNRGNMIIKGDNTTLYSNNYKIMICY